MDLRNLLSQVYKKENIYKTTWFATDEKIRFAITAAANMIFRYLMFVIMGELFPKMHYQSVLALMWFLSSFVAFFSYKILVFRTSGNHLKEYAKSIATWSISYLINAVILFILVKKLSLGIFIAQALAISVIMVVNYLMFKHFAFKKELSRWEKFVELFDNLSK